MSDALFTDIKDGFDSFSVVDVYKNYEVISKPRIVIKRTSIQKCKICGEEMLSFIVDHIKRKHPEVDE